MKGNGEIAGFRAHPDSVRVLYGLPLPNRGSLLEVVAKTATATGQVHRSRVLQNGSISATSRHLPYCSAEGHIVENGNRCLQSTLSMQHTSLSTLANKKQHQQQRTSVQQRVVLREKVNPFQHFKRIFLKNLPPYH
jgi:hypothetical protein